MKKTANQNKADTTYYEPNLKVYFVLRRPKRSLSSLYVDLSIKSVHCQTSFIQHVETKYWLPKLQKFLVTPSNPEYQAYNDRILLARAEFQRLLVELRVKGIMPTARLITNAYLEKHGIRNPPKTQSENEAKRISFGNLVEQFLEWKLNQKRKPVSDLTKQAYLRYNRIVNEYMASLKRGKSAVLYVDNITEQWAENLHNWCISERNYVNDYANDVLKFVKQVCKYAFEANLVPLHPLKTLKLYDTNVVDTTCLEPDELQRLIDIDFTKLPISPATAKSLSDERDCFVLTCYIGLHHADLKGPYYRIDTGIDGNLWLMGNREKTGIEVKVPLHPVALSILEKHGGLANLPIRSNPKRNKLLKQLAFYARINKRLSTKTGRKTFANYLLNVKKIRTETVAKLLGQNTTKYVKHYARITEKSILEELQF